MASADVIFTPSADVLPSTSMINEPDATPNAPALDASPSLSISSARKVSAEEVAVTIESPNTLPVAADSSVIAPAWVNASVTSIFPAEVIVSAPVPALLIAVPVPLPT